jgi:hypothetical protein
VLEHSVFATSLSTTDQLLSSDDYFIIRRDFEANRRISLVRAIGMNGMGFGGKTQRMQGCQEGFRQALITLEDATRNPGL